DRLQGHVRGPSKLVSILGGLMGRVEGGRAGYSAVDVSASHTTIAALAIASVSIVAAAFFGMAASIGWFPRPFSPQRVAGTAPVDSLSPGEAVVTIPRTPELTHAERRRPVATPDEPEQAEAQTVEAPPLAPVAAEETTAPARPTESPPVRPRIPEIQFAALPPLEETSVEATYAELRVPPIRVAEVGVAKPKGPRVLDSTRKPVEPVRVETRIAESRPAEPKPVEAKPVEQKPAEPKVAEAKRVEPKYELKPIAPK